MPIFTVDTTSDVIDAHDGVLSLREALARADATEAADTIRFADAVQGGTIVLAGSQLTVASEVTIDGGSGVTLDADGRSRVLLVQEPEGDRHAWITLAHLTITSGRTREGEGGGAGIYSVARYDSLDLDHVTVTGNRAAGDGGGISGFYAIGLSDSIVTDNRAVGSGGGISGYYVSLANSTVSGNEVRGRYASGGGISAGEHLWLVNSTVSDNSALGSDASGGGVDGHHVAVYDSTITGNRAAGPNASGGGISSYGYARLIGSTISGNQAKGSNANGGGIGGGEQYIYNSIVAGNAATANADADVYGFVYSNGANIFGSRVAGSLPSDGQDIQPDKIFAAVDPRTGGGLLADNSGPTQTIALRDADDNPALGRGDPDAAFETDQRGEARPEPDDTRPDIGAFELDQSDPQPPPVAATFVVTSTGDTIADDGVLTLREALTLADADSVTVDRISFAPDLQNETIVLSGGQLEVHSDITIDGAGVTIDAHGVSRVLLVQGLDTDVTLRQLTLTGGQTGEGQGGGGIRADRTTSLTLDHVSVVSNISADADGGGIWANDVTLIGSTVSGNSTTGHFARGGGIFGYFGSDVTLINSTVSGNSTTGASAEGGGIYGTHIRLTNSTVNR
ncbi:MAG: choice-of-anchor Q domain-containing protein, partial [Geminicoccaceae bacterium]